MKSQRSSIIFENLVVKVCNSDVDKTKETPNVCLVLSTSIAETTRY